MKESHRRTLIKTVSYRILGATVTGALTWWFTGSIEMGLTLGTADTLAKFGLYYAHERAWARIPLGNDPAQNASPSPRPSLRARLLKPRRPRLTDPQRSSATT
jgi:uncharacterized membrane protein